MDYDDDYYDDDYYDGDYKDDDDDDDYVDDYDDDIYIYNGEVSVCMSQKSDPAVGFFQNFKKIKIVKDFQIF